VSRWPRRQALVRRAADALRPRLDALSPDARRTLTVAATAGRAAEFDLLSAVTELTEPRLVAALKELIAARLLAEERPDLFAFAQRLVGKAVTAQLLDRERRQLHHQIAITMENVAGASAELRAGELGRHYYAAGQYDAALKYARIAGEQEVRRDAPRAALRQFDRALACATHLGQEHPVDLLLVRAELREQTGHFDGADADLRAALAEAERAGQHRQVWQALLRLGFLWAARDYRVSLDWLKQGLAVTDGLDDPLARAETLNRIGNVYLNRDQPEEALPYHQAALEAFQAAGDPAGEANTLELMAVCHYNTPDVLAGVECEERALALARSAGAKSVFFHVAIHLLLPVRFETEVCPPIRAAERIALGEEALRLARAMGWAAGESQALGLLGGFHGVLGQYDRALPRLGEGLELARQLEHVAGISAAERMLAAILLDLLALDEAAERLRVAAAVATGAGAFLFADIASLALAQALAERGRPADLPEARELITALLGRTRMAGGRLRREALCARAQVEMAEGDFPAAVATLESLIADARHLSDGNLEEVPRLALLLGRALAGAQRLEEAETALEAAVRGSETQGRLPLQWRAYAALGRLRFELRQRKAAAQQFEKARELIARLGAMIPDAELRLNFTRKALGTMPRPPVPTQRSTEKALHHGLTQREREVARLIAEGHSNREISVALVISERTVERHVANILLKRDLTSRVQLAVWVAENLPAT
jgi:DNA-binding CsgD family transcriptional regulator